MLLRRAFPSNCSSSSLPPSPDFDGESYSKAIVFGDWQFQTEAWRKVQWEDLGTAGVVTDDELVRDEHDAIIGDVRPSS